jgi:glutamine amidotransferase
VEKVVVIDYGMGNLRSVAKALEHVANGSADIVVSSHKHAIDNADRVIFPGQGAIRDCMVELSAHGLLDAVRNAIADKPFLGICLGQQALMDHSEEHPETKGLGIFPGAVNRFPTDARDESTGARLKVPHMGWNSVMRTRDHALWRGIEDGAYFYFVHSYYIQPEDVSLTVGRTRYAGEFASAIARDKLFAVQFHPEKSAVVGLTLLRNFLAWDGND